MEAWGVSDFGGEVSRVEKVDLKCPLPIKVGFAAAALALCANAAGAIAKPVIDSALFFATEATQSALAGGAATIASGLDALFAFGMGTAAVFAFLYLAAFFAKGHIPNQKSDASLALA